jgi:transketolase
VRIVGVGGGFDYGTAGPTHHGLEDVGVMRLQPGLTVVAPADHEQARAALLATWDQPGPVYYRLGKDDRLTVPGLAGRFSLGHADLVREGDELLFVTMGSIAPEVVAAAEALAAEDVSAAVLVVASMSPAPVEDLAKVLARFRLAVSVEAHYVAGGVGSLVAEVIAEQGLRCRLVRHGVRSAPDGTSGSTSYHHGAHGLSASLLARTARRALAGW